MRRSVTAESIPIKFCTSTPWGDVVICLTWHRNWLKGFGGVGCENEPLPLTLASASNTAYCATAHTRDIWAIKASFAWKMMEISQPKGNKRMQNDIFRKKWLNWVIRPSFRLLLTAEIESRRPRHRAGGTAVSHQMNLQFQLYWYRQRSMRNGVYVTIRCPSGASTPYKRWSKCTMKK